MSRRPSLIRLVVAMAIVLMATIGLALAGCGQPALTETNLKYGETATRNGLEITFGKPVHKPGFTYDGKERWEGSYRVVGGREDIYFTQDDFLIVDGSGNTYQCVGASPRPDPEVPRISTWVTNMGAGAISISEHGPIWYLPQGVGPVAVVYLPSWTQSWKVTWR